MAEKTRRLSAVRPCSDTQGLSGPLLSAGSLSCHIPLVQSLLSPREQLRPFLLGNQLEENE